jgi:hypothetical protein
MYAGDPAHFALISDEVEIAGIDNPDCLSRRHIQETVRKAYRKVCSRFSSFDSLNPFDMTMDEFKKSGIKSFGEDFHAETLRRINQKAGLFGDQLLVTGWGKAPHSVMIYEVSPSGDWLHMASGFAAIGSGGQMALTMLLQLGQARYRTLAETIFNVACAKFSSEKSSGLDVGQMTTIYVSRKRTEQEDEGKIYGDFIQKQEIQQLRELWDGYLKPRVPDEAWRVLTSISASLSGGAGNFRDMANRVNAENRILKSRLKIYEEVKAAGSPGPQYPTDDSSLQPPSQGSHGGSGES